MFVYNGMKVFESLMMVQDGDPYQVRRTWRERLFEMPWRPFRSHRWVTPKVPRTDVVIMGDAIIGHPETVRQLRNAIKEPA